MFNKKSFSKNPNYSTPKIVVEIIEEPKIETLEINNKSLVKPKRKYVKKNK